MKGRRREEGGDGGKRGGGGRERLSLLETDRQETEENSLFPTVLSSLGSSEPELKHRFPEETFSFISLWGCADRIVFESQYQHQKNPNPIKSDVSSSNMMI